MSTGPKSAARTKKPAKPGKGRRGRVRRRQTSMAINDHWLAGVEKGSHPYALTALYRYLEYKARGDSAQMMKWVVESALADVRHAVMNQAAS